MIREKIFQAIASAIRVLPQAALSSDFTVPSYSVEVSERADHGDYSTNAALLPAKSIGQKPMDIANSLAERIKSEHSEWLADVRVAPPGFINFFIKNEFLVQSLDSVLNEGGRWGTSGDGAGKTVMVEYFQLNIAKRPHIGHLRSAVIGDTLKRIFQASGYHAVSDTHVGDWGTQFGILLQAYKENRENREDIERMGDPFDAFEKLYIEENARIEADPELRERAKQEFAKLEAGDPENRKIWQWMVDVSMKKLGESSSRLGLLPFDEHKGESAYEDAMPDIVELALQKGVATKISDGAIIVDLGAEGLDQAVLIKSDGASTYLLRDLATIRYRKGHWKFRKNLYVVDTRQSHHFKQVFRVAELLGFEGVGESEHVEFGFMSLPEGALSTRKGTAISLDAVLDEAHDRARKVIEEKNPDLANADAVADAVGIGALKYFDLAHHRKSDIVFRWDEALSFDGNTGPYLQYTHARLKSILRKVGGEKIENIENIKNIEKIKMDEVEHRLLMAILRFPEAVSDVLLDYAPNVLANYLYNLAKLANEFYHLHSVSQETDRSKRDFRIALVSGVALTIARGLKLLGIQAPEEM